MKKEIIIQTISDLPAVSKQFLNEYGNVKVMAFYGSMGAGKTTFIKHLCNQLNIIDNVASPTFSIINEYADGIDTIAYHFDFYRIKDETEALDIGYEDYIYSGKFCFIEWPEKIESLLPENILRIQIDVMDNQLRKLTIQS